MLVDAPLIPLSPCRVIVLRVSLLQEEDRSSSSFDESPLSMEGSPKLSHGTRFGISIELALVEDLHSLSLPLEDCLVEEGILGSLQWNLRIRDTFGAGPLSFILWLSLSQRFPLGCILIAIKFYLEYHSNTCCKSHSTIVCTTKCHG